MTVTATTPESRTPPKGPGAGYWVKKNLFNSVFDSILTIVFGLLALYVVFRVALFVFVNGRWEIIQANLKLLMVGRWPSEELMVISVSLSVIGLWGGIIAGLIAARQIRVGTSAASGMSVAQRSSDLVRRFGLIMGAILLLLLLTSTSGPWITTLFMLVSTLVGYWVGRVLGRLTLARWLVRVGVLVLLVAPIAVFFYLTSAVPLAEWEGFLFNMTSAAAGIVLSFPIGVLLALGRRSKLPLLKSVSIVYIEFVRGSPLFVLLLLANVSLEFFVPAALAPSKVVRAIVTFTIFTASYIAEIVRGGLQSVPRGQEEAAKALGLSPTKQMFRIVMPQALRNVIPAQIGQFISLFKDTTLAGAALGILDLLAAGEAITQQPDFRGQGLIIESLVFVAFLFWVG
ncbi:MAG: amino acid ABC transporter permease, partial [Acidimicrobiia bacterium]